ncbi:hypothetical protein GUITHDRAFT_143937, partial [Guillardia theta CCMP2712]
MLEMIDRTGVGLLMQFDPTALCVVIKGCVKGGAADRDGRIEASDVIVAVDGVEARDKSIEQVREMIIGPQGSSVTLKLKKAQGETLESVLVRGTPEYLDSLGGRANQTVGEVSASTAREGEQ